MSSYVSEQYKPTPANGSSDSQATCEAMPARYLKKPPTLFHRHSRDISINPQEALWKTTQKDRHTLSLRHPPGQEAIPLDLCAACHGNCSACPSHNHGEGDKTCGRQQPERTTLPPSGKSPRCTFRKKTPRPLKDCCDPFSEPPHIR